MMLDNVKWSAGMAAVFSLPPDPLITANWKEEWLGRLETLRPLLDEVLTHPLRDDYYKRMSICDDISKIKAASFLLAGTADRYSNNLTGALKGIKSPKRAIIGPWVHVYPHLAEPRPRLDFCAEALKWWDRWLKEKEVEQDQPDFLIYLQNREPANPRAEHVEGQWICDPTAEDKLFYMKDGKLGEDRGKSTLTFRTKETTRFWNRGATWPSQLADLPGDQSVDDMESCYFETEPFSEDTSFCGNPVVHVSIASDKPVASVFVRLCKENNAGKSLLLSYSAWNLTHDTSHETFTPLQSSEFKEVDVKLDLISEKIEKGSCLRLCFTTGLFPIFVPNPEPATFTLDLIECHLKMPKLLEYIPYAKPISEPLNPTPLPTTQLSQPHMESRCTTDDKTGQRTQHTHSSTGRRRFEEHGLITEWKTETKDTILPDDPSSAQVQVRHETNW